MSHNIFTSDFIPNSSSYLCAHRTLRQLIRYMHSIGKSQIGHPRASPCSSPPDLADHDFAKSSQASRIEGPTGKFNQAGLPVIMHVSMAPFTRV